MDANPRSIGLPAKAIRFGGWTLAKGPHHLSLIRALTPNGQHALIQNQAQAILRQGDRFRACGVYGVQMGPEKTLPFRTAVPILAVGGSVLVFGLSPLLRFADPVQIWIAAIVIAIVLTMNLAQEKARGQLGLVLSIQIVGYAAVGIAVWWASDWTASSGANDRRCIAIQRDMLSAKPLRDDGPDLFQALGCRPQGEGSVYREPSYAELVAAGRISPAAARKVAK
ncbi:hypothetical protein [Sphingomonas sp. PB4P5]|uniref:hypothetical protein n=1 Tax=Parasphingomonas puruogangriensis TaxID=3096155 RepID=UPI002FCBDEBC